MDEVWGPLESLYPPDKQKIPSWTDAAPPDGLRYSVVVPVFNEAENIGPYCARARAELPPGYELLVCYDFDGDTTLPALAAIPADKKPPVVRLVSPADGRGWDSRGHFFAAAAEAMRRILIDAARTRAARKRGGAWKRIDLNAVDIAGHAAPDDLL